MIVTTDCPHCGAEFRLDYDPGEERVDYFRDGTGDPGSAPDAEIVDEGCTCIADEAVDEERIIEITLERQADAAWSD